MASFVATVRPVVRGVFVSYAAADAAVALRLINALRHAFDGDEEIVDRGTYNSSAAMALDAAALIALVSSAYEHQPTNQPTFFLSFS
jgi:hypothetical protein